MVRAFIVLVPQFDMMIHQSPYQVHVHNKNHKALKAELHHTSAFRCSEYSPVASKHMKPVKNIEMTCSLHILQQIGCLLSAIVEKSTVDNVSI